MTQHTDVPVLPHEIRIGDYVGGSIATLGSQNEGFVVDTAPGTVVIQDSSINRPYRMGRTIRTFTRRVHAMNHDLALVNPKGIIIGDRIWIYEGSRQISSGEKVMQVHSCPSADDAVDLVMDSGFLRCHTRYEDVELYRHTGQEPAVGEWREIPFADLRPDDQVRATFTSAYGEELVTEGTVIEILGTRARIRKEGNVIRDVTSRRTFFIRNRTPAPTPDLATRYPTLHHLRAAIYDVVLPNYVSGEWCDGAHDFVRSIGIMDSLHESSRDKAQAEVQELIAVLQSESAEDRRISPASLEAASQALGIPLNPPPPPTTRFQIEIDTQGGLTEDEIRAMLQGSSRVTNVNRVQEVPR